MTPLLQPPLLVRLALRNSGWLASDAFLRVAATTVVSLWVARQLGPAAFGLLNFASALAALFAGAALMGLEVPAVLRLTRSCRDGTRNARDERTWLGTLLALRLGSALLATAAAALAAAWLATSDAQRWLAWIGALSIAAAAPSAVDAGFRARLCAGPPARARSAAALAGAAARVAAVLGGAGLQGLATVLVAEAALTSALLWRAWTATAGQAPSLRDARPDAAAELLRAALPYAAIGSATLLMMKGDVVLLGHLASARQTGVYALAQKMSEVVCIVPVALADTAYPFIQRHLSAGVSGLAPEAPPEAAGQLMFDTVFGATFIAVIVAVAVAPPLVQALFGSDYDAAAALFRWHAWTCLPVALDVARLRWLAVSGPGVRAAWPAAALGALLSLGLNLWAVRGFGPAGAVGVALLSYTAMGLGMSFAVPALRPVARMQWRALWPWQRLAQAWRQGRGA